MYFFFIVGSNQRSESGRSISRLVYWYGAELGQAFSLVPATKITPYEKGVKKGWNLLPNTIKKKIKKQKSLTAKEKLLVKNLKAAKADYSLPPNKRSLFLFDFVEEHDESDDDSDDNSHVCEVSSNHIDEDERNKGDSDDDENGADDKNVDEKISSNGLKRGSLTDDSSSASNKKSRLKKRPRDSSNDTKMSHKNCEIDQNDVIDMRVLLKPKYVENKSGNGEKAKVYTLLVQQNGEIISDSELRISDADKPFSKKLTHQNITLNLSFKL